MTNFAGKIAAVESDDLDVTRTVTAIPTGQALTKAWLTIKAAPRAADPGLLQKVITAANAPGVGQITDDGTGDTVGALIFQLTNADTAGLPINIDVPYDIKVLTSAGKVYTVEQGKYNAAPCLTKAVS